MANPVYTKSDNVSHVSIHPMKVAISLIFCQIRSVIVKSIFDK